MTRHESSDQVPQELLDDCRVLASRVELLKRMPTNGTVAEVGTYKGNFARSIKSITSPRELHLIDVNYSKFKEDGLTEKDVYRHKGLSHEILSGFENNYFDWIYIDADHTYERVLRDAEIGRKKVKGGGYLIFNDFGHAAPSGARFGVHRAATEFCIKYNWKWKFLSYQKNALYDLALQKPEEEFSS